MSESSGRSVAASTGMRGTALPHGAIHCTGIHCAVARTIWPIKTAEHWAAAAGVKPRMAKYWLAGRKVGDAGKLALRRLLD